MNHEFTFRIVVIVLFSLLAAIGIYHRTQAAKSDEKITRQKEGVLIMILLRLFGFSMWIGLLIYMINPQWMEWSAFLLPSWLRWLGAAFGIMAIPLIYWMFSSLGKNVTDTVVIRKEHSLITHGPYRLIRHPMYLFSFLYFTGLSLLTANWFIWITGLLALALLIVRTPIEEAALIAKFGDEYRSYLKRTGRFFPRFGKM